MVTIEDLSNIIENDVLHELYMARDLTLADITEKDKNNLEELNKKVQSEYQELLNIFGNIPEIFEILLQDIKTKIENHVDNNVQLSAYFDEKLYKCGVIDGINLILESRCKKDVK